MQKPQWAQCAHIFRDQRIQYRVEVGYMDGDTFIPVDILYTDDDPVKIAQNHYPGIEVEYF